MPLQRHGYCKRITYVKLSSRRECPSTLSPTVVKKRPVDKLLEGEKHRNNCWIKNLFLTHWRYNIMARRVRPLTSRVSEAREKLERLELQAKIKELKAKFGRRKKRR